MRKNLYLDSKKFNLMLERMEKRVSFDESVELKNKLLLNEGLGATIKQLAKGGATAIESLPRATRMLVRGLEGDLKSLDDLFALDDVRVKLNNELVDLGLSANAVKGLDNFLDMTTAVKNASSPKKVYTNMMDDMLGKGLDVDTSIAKIEDFYFDNPKLMDEVMAGSDELQLRQGEPQKTRTEKIKTVIDQNYKNLDPNTKKVYIKHFRKNRRLSGGRSLEEMLEGTDIDLNNNTLFKKQGEDGYLLVNNKDLDDIELSNALKEAGYNKVDTKAKVNTSTKQKIKDFFRTPQKGKVVRSERLEWIKWAAKFIPVQYALYLLVDAITCAKNKLWDHDTVVDETGDNLQKWRDALKNNEKDADGNPAYLQYEREIEFTECWLPLLNPNKWLTDEDKAWFNDWAWLPWVGPFVPIVENVGIALADYSTLKQQIHKEIEVIIYEQLRKALEKFNPIQLAKEGKFCDYDSENLTKLIKDINKDEFIAYENILSTLGIEQNISDSAIESLIAANEAYAGTADDIKRDIAETKKRIKIQNNGLSGTKYDDVKFNRGDLSSQFNTYCEYEKGKLLLEKLSISGDYGDDSLKQIDYDLQFYTENGNVSKLFDGKTYKDGVPNEIKVENFNINKENIINTLKFTSNVAEARGTTDVQTKAQDFISKFESSNPLTKEELDELVYKRYELSTTPEVPEEVKNEIINNGGGAIVVINNPDENEGFGADFEQMSSSDLCMDADVTLIQLLGQSGKKYNPDLFKKLQEFVKNNQNIKTVDGRKEFIINDATTKIMGEFYCEKISDKSNCIKAYQEKMKSTYCWGKTNSGS